jgi:hypothetical protein
MDPSLEKVYNFTLLQAGRVNTSQVLTEHPLETSKKHFKIEDLKAKSFYKKTYDINLTQ